MFSGDLPMEMPPLGTGTLFTRTEDQIYTALKTMKKPDGKIIQGPMLFMQAT